jgi:hypothetical protein
MESVSKKKLLETKKSLIEALKSLSQDHRFGENKDEDEYLKNILIAATLYETYLNGFVAAIEAKVFKDSEIEQALKVIFVADKLCTDIDKYLKE